MSCLMECTKHFDLKRSKIFKFRKSKKKGVELNLSDWGTGIPDNDKRAHAREREQSAYHLVV